MPNYTDDEKKQILKDLNDPQKVQVYCGDHFYFGPQKDKPEIKPHKGCSKCWFVYYFLDIATTPPSQRQERLDELEEVIHHLVESVEKKEFDFKINRHPEITIEKGND